MAKAKKTGKKSGGAKKYGRNLEKCARYRAAGRREFNKARKARKIARMLEKKAARKARKLAEKANVIAKSVKTE